VGGGFTFCLGNLPLMRAASVNDLHAPIGFAEALVCLSLPEGLPRFLDGSFVPLLTAEHAVETPRSLRQEILPPRSRDRDPKRTEIKWRHHGAAPERGEADSRISH
jgi:hypothetical protein